MFNRINLLTDTQNSLIIDKNDANWQHKLEKAYEEAFEQVYAYGDRVMQGFILLHTLLAFALAWVHQVWAVSIAAGLSIALLFFASVYFMPRSFFTRLVASVCLQLFVLLHIYQLQGIEESRFFFFTAFTMMIVYRDWKAVAIGALLLITEYVVFNYLEQYNSLSPVSNQHKAVGNYTIQEMNALGVFFYFFISIMQVVLASWWAYILSLYTKRRVESNLILLEKREIIAKHNEILEQSIAEKTQELQRSLEIARANEEELRQNMEELQATQEELEKQANQILEKNMRLEIAEKELLSKQEEMQRRQWIETNISHFDNLMRLNYDKSLQEFSEILLSHLAELLGALQAAMYVYNPENQLLEMTSGYACTSKTVLKPAFAIGDGLLGQAAKTQKMIYMDNIKEGAAEVASALNRIRSKSLLILPMVYNDKLQGLLEFALIQPVSDMHLELLQTLSKNMAAVLLNIQNILHTKKLLLQSQEMAKEMQKNNQELRRIKAEMDKQVAELKNQYEVINRVMLVIEYAPNGLILNVNQNFLNLSKYTKEELIGKHQSVFIAPDFVASQEYRNIWERAKNNELQNAIYKCRDKEGNEFWIKSNHYVAGEQENRRFIAFGIDITAQKQAEEKLKYAAYK
ncbi:MAG: GAF domain-containing protein [Microscillaceae bacterium]|nr:GAF domain-containing protein [Microscillaceae bacterium]MDW8460542.1 GAF domain-containing protein [Cytophagales bacterium]